ncbi:energy transducer TonB [uncultured Acetobacteroides sp.]|uniref:energy transducer TonB n=1 Tax=uncultured Acetobacteroides sp. TaxID=1760811 RepID=UPI0029F572D9|nr:energy transducer TonB [uncultured Acetobacteroides sp.]
MKRITLSARIKGLQLRSNWYGLLFALTRNRRFFDRKIKAGVLILSLLNLVAGCGNQTNEKPASSQKEQSSKRLTKADTPKSMVSKGIPVKFAPPQITCYDVEVKQNLVQPDTTDLTVGCYAPIIEEGPSVYSTVEDMPEFPGGVDAMMQYIKERAIYPDSLEDDNIVGTVFVRMVINSRGKIEQPTIIKGITPEVDSAALRIVRQMPRWEPGWKEGVPVNVYYTIPVKFNHKVNE